MVNYNDERMFAFEDLLVWQKSIDFAEVVIKTIERKTLSEHKLLGEEISKMLNSLIRSIKSEKN